MGEISQLIAYLQILIPIGAAARTTYCCIVMYMNEEEKGSYKARIRNALIFAVLAETISGLLRIIIPSYF